MKVVVIGAPGTIGRAIVAALSPRHDVVEVGKSRGALTVDIRNFDSVRGLFEKIGAFDAVVTASGNVHFGPLSTMTADQFRVGLDDKLMGQINVVLAARDLISPGGSFTLTSGILSHEPVLPALVRAPSMEQSTVSCAPPRSNCLVAFGSIP